MWRVTCDECGDVEVKGKTIELRICLDTGEASYNFLCPVCRMRTAKVPTDTVIEIMKDAGIRCVEWRLPPEVVR